MRRRILLAETGLPSPACEAGAVATPAASGPARCQSCARCARALPASRPGSSALPTRARPVPPGCGDGSPPCRPPSASARNGFPGRCTARRTRLCARSLPAVPPSPSSSIPPPPVGRVDLARGIVQNHDQVVPAFVLKPLVPAAVDVQQHPRQRPPLPPFAMRPALASARHQARSLQGLLHPGITQLDPVLGLQLLLKVLHVQIEVLLPIQRKHSLHCGHRHPSTRRLAPPPVEQPVVALFLVALATTPHVPVADAQNLRRLPPRDLLRHRLQHHILYFHRPLHRGLRVGIHASHGLPSPPAKRTYHVLSQPDISCATDTTLTSP